MRRKLRSNLGASVRGVHRALTAFQLPIWLQPPLETLLVSLTSSCFIGMCQGVNRTTMIPKSAEPGVGDWRPITVASVIDRLFAKILESRQSKAVTLNSDQRGFMQQIDGCGENRW